MDLWYNGPIDHDSGVAERKGSLNRRCGRPLRRRALRLCYNSTIPHGVSGIKDFDA